MKYLNFKKTLLFGSAAALSAVTSFAQVIPFQIDGVGSEQGRPVQASGSLDFSGLVLGGGYTGKLVVTITNTSPESSDPSFISAFWLRRPVLNGANLTGESLVQNESNPDTWGLTSDFNSNGNVTSIWEGPELDYADYFGAVLQPPENDGLPRTGEFAPATFVFNFGPNFILDINEWLGAGVDEPLMFVRWQGIGTEGDSSKGYGGGGKPFEPNIVPEPALIAPLAFVGLVGFLWARRRLVAKK